jgi:transcriptional regulator with XRE-family HTH domain
METIGDILRNKRLEKGLTLEDVSNLVKIRKKYLEALESGNYNEIPGTVYAKSFLKIYADFLGLDRFYILKRYQSEIMPEQNIVIPPTYYMPINNQKSKRASRTKLFLYIIATIIGIVLIVWGINSLRSSDTTSNIIDEKIIENPLPNNQIEPPEIEVPIEEIIVTPQKPQKITHNFDKLALKIDSNAYSWISKTIDGKNTTSYTMLPNKSESFDARKSVNLRIGNASGIKINVNGFDLGNLGKSGEVIDLRITLNSKESIEVEIKRGNGSIEKKILKD